MGSAGTAPVLTPSGGAAIAVVRLVGPGVGAFLAAHFSKPAREGRCVHGELTDGGRVVDDPVIVLHPGGGVADVSLHGGPWVVRAALDLARRYGFEATESAEWSVPERAIAEWGGTRSRGKSPLTFRWHGRNWRSACCWHRSGRGRGSILSG